jgi:hypothetical protein
VASAGKPYESKKPHKKFGGNKSMAFMQTMFKAYKAKKAGKSKKRKKHGYDSSDSSNSEEDTGCSKMKTSKKNKTKKKPWQGDLIHQQAFDNVKAAIAKEVVLAYPDFLKSYEIYTDAYAT